jgi:hypothetical protein
MNLSDEYDNSPCPDSAESGGEEMEWREDEFRFQPDQDASAEPEDSLIPLAAEEHDASGEVEFLGGPPQEGPADSRGGHVPDVIPARQMHSPWPGRLVMLAILGGLAYGTHAGWKQLKAAWGEFTGNVQYIHAKGEDSPDRKKLVEGHLDRTGRLSAEQSDAEYTGTADGDEAGESWAGKLLGAGSATGSKNAPAQPSRKDKPNTLSSGGYTLSAIVAGPSGRVAMINGRCVRKGDRVDGATVDKITDNSATLSKGGDSIVLKW